MSSDFSMEWNLICRVCLQEGEMKSLFDKDDANISYGEKIMQCSSITIEQGLNLPEQICLRCIADLSIAYTFRINCESSNAILQSFVENQMVTELVVSADASGSVYHYKPPTGLNVRRINKNVIKEEPMSNDEDEENDITNEDIEFLEGQDDQYNLNESDNIIEELTFATNRANIQHNNVIQQKKQQISENKLLNQVDYSGNEYILDEKLKSEDHELLKNKIKEYPVLLSMDELVEVTPDDEIDIQTVRPVKTNKYNRPRVFKIPTASASLQNITSQILQDGTETTVLRVKKGGIKIEPKPSKVCEICGNVYKYRHALESHMRRHKGEKPFACEICGRAFVIAFELKRHMRTHTGQKPYSCKYCDRKFSDFGSRIKHERTHTGERPYHCETCGKSFAYSHVLSSHMLTHTGIKKFGCDRCGKHFAKSHHLKAHMNTHIRPNIKSTSNLLNKMLRGKKTITNNNTNDTTINNIDVITLFEINTDTDSKLELLSDNDDVDDDDENSTETII